MTGFIRAENDFLSGAYADVVWGTGVLVSNAFDPFGFTSVHEGSFASTIDEPGGILAITTDTGDDDNACLFNGAYFARDGGCRMGARFKYSNTDCAVMVGFSDLISLTTPVMPLEFATATMTYLASTNVVGFNYDVDGTTDDFRAAMGQSGAGISDSSTTGVRANATVTADRWFEAQVTIGVSGITECWLSDSGHIDGDNVPNLRLVKRFSTGTLISQTVGLLAELIIENRSGNARVLEVDYMWAEGNRDRRFN